MVFAVDGGKSMIGSTAAIFRELGIDPRADGLPPAEESNGDALAELIESEHRLARLQKYAPSQAEAINQEINRQRTDARSQGSRPCP